MTKVSLHRRHHHHRRQDVLLTSDASSRTAAIHTLFAVTGDSSRASASAPMFDRCTLPTTFLSIQVYIESSGRCEPPSRENGCGVCSGSERRGRVKYKVVGVSAMKTTVALSACSKRYNECAYGAWMSRECEYSKVLDGTQLICVLRSTVAACDTVDAPPSICTVGEKRGV